MTTLENTGELEIIRKISRYLPRRPDIIRGLGDDCAVVRMPDNPAEDLLLTSDAVIEGTHFTHQTPLADVGHKAAGRVLSDIAAMGGEPRWALIDIAAPGDLPLADLESLYAEASCLSSRFGMAIVGGDTARADRFQIHVFAVGAVPRGQAVLRSGTRPGDLIFVTGSLGCSILSKHLHFTPRVPEGQFLRDYATAMIDVSDGLATDLQHLTEASRTGACISLDDIPISPEATTIRDGLPPWQHALSDGEDFELLFSIPPDREKVMQDQWNKRFSVPCRKIGTITPEPGRIVYKDPAGKPVSIPAPGYEHFSRRSPGISRS